MNPFTAKNQTVWSQRSICFASSSYSNKHRYSISLRICAGHVKVKMTICLFHEQKQ